MIVFVSILMVGSLISVLFPPRGRFAAALVLAISSFVLIPADAFEIGALSSIASVIAGLVFLCLAAVTALRPIRVTGTAIALIGLVVIGEVSAALSPEPNLFAMVVALAAPAVFLIASSLSTRERSAVLSAVVCLAAFEALVCAYEAFIIGKPLMDEATYSWRRQGARVLSDINPFFEGTIRGQGTLGHPLVAALVMLIGIGCTFALRWRLVVKIPVIGLLTLGVLSTGSSSAVVVCAFCLVAAFIISGGWKSRPLKILLVVVAGAVAATGGGSLTQSIIADIGGANLTHRTNSLTALPRLLTERNLLEAFFGSGWGSAESLYRRDILINDGFYAIDNQFTTIVAFSGIVGVALYVGALAFILVKARGPLRVTLLTILIMSLSFNVLSWVATSSLFWFVAACALAGLGGHGSELRPSGGAVSDRTDAGEGALNPEPLPAGLPRKL